MQINLNDIYQETKDDCGSNPPKELIENTFYCVLKEKTQQWLKTKIKAEQTAGNIQPDEPKKKRIRFSKRSPYK